MSTYGNVNFGDPFLMMEGPRLQSLRAGKSRWQCFAISYAVQGAVLTSLLTVTIASPCNRECDWLRRIWLRPRRKLSQCGPWSG
jgi:hypothetical protein